MRAFRPAGSQPGVLPGIGGTQRLTRAVGKAKAMDMCLTGRQMDAAEAERAGPVARVFPAESLLEETLKAARVIAEKSLPATMMIKESVNRAFGDHAGRRHPLRASSVPCGVRDRRPEGRHGRVQREAQA